MFRIGVSKDNESLIIIFGNDKMPLYKNDWSLVCMLHVDCNEMQNSEHFLLGQKLPAPHELGKMSNSVFEQDCL